jgi:hypothetical protein
MRLSLPFSNGEVPAIFKYAGQVEWDLCGEPGLLLVRYRWSAPPEEVRLK